MWKPERHVPTIKCDIICSLVLFLKHYFVIMEEGGKKLKIICQCCNGFVSCSGMNGELLYINLFHAELSALWLYSGELVSEKFYFQWLARIKIQCLYQKLLKEGNGNQKYLRYTDVWDNNFFFLIEKSQWIRLPLSVDKLLKLNQEETIQILLPPQTHSIFWYTVR